MKQPIFICSLTTVLLAPVAAADPGDRRHDRMLNRMDVNDDGLITLDEFRGPGRRGAGLPGHADADGDGNITIDELNLHLDEREAKQTERMAEARARATEHFATNDNDGDGMVTPDEARAGSFSRLDSNGDGALTPDEMRAAKGHRKGFRNRMGRMAGSRD